jgi:hypothetical protein
VSNKAEGLDEREVGLERGVTVEKEIALKKRARPALCRRDVCNPAAAG